MPHATDKNRPDTTGPECELQARRASAHTRSACRRDSANRTEGGEPRGPVMWDRYDPRPTDDRDRGDVDQTAMPGGSAESRDAHDQNCFEGSRPAPRAQRRPVRERDRVYEIDGIESRILATVGAFRVVSERDLHDGREDSRRAQRHLEQEGLLRSSALSADDRASSLPTEVETCSRRIGMSVMTAPGSHSRRSTLASESA